MRFVLVLAAVAASVLVWRSRHGPEVWHALDERSA
ncbi:hypothetical protein MMON44395_18240 [Mycolicibacterium monacense DSM 44395]|nr:hypothetical protein [Mycolicibacterium monacense DSM 44395]